MKYPHSAWILIEPQTSVCILVLVIQKDLSSFPMNEDLAIYPLRQDSQCKLNMIHNHSFQGRVPCVTC